MTTQFAIPTAALSACETLPFTALTFSTKATLRSMHQFNSIPQALYDEAQRLELTPAGPIQYVYTGVNGDETNEFDLEIALPVNPSAIESVQFVSKVFESFHCISYTFTGPWDAFMAMYDALFAAFYQAGYQTDRRVREVYTVVDLNNPDQCVTEIQIGLQQISLLN